MLVLLSAPPAPGARPADELAAAAAAYQRGDFSACAGDCRTRPGGPRLERGLLLLLRGQCAFYAGKRKRALGCFDRAQRLLPGSLRRLARARRADTLWELGKRRRALELYWRRPPARDSLVDGAAGAGRIVEFARLWESDRRGAAGKG